MYKRLLLIGIIFLSILASFTSQAQGITGATISGTVIDERGGLAPEPA